MRYRFGPYEVDASARVLSGPHGPIPLQPRAFSLLVHLIEQRQRALSVGELIEAVWSGETVTTASLTQAVRSIRKALGDDGDAQGVVRTVRRHGYQFVAELEGEPATPSAPLLGRHAEGAELRAALAAVQTGGPRLILVEGEAGIGKTTLVQAFADRLRGEGVTVAWGSAHPHPDAPPFWPWITALQALEAQRASAQPISPTLDVSDATPQDLFRRFNAVRAWLSALAADRAAVVIFEDLHWADASTLQLLDFVLREPSRARLLFVGTWRSWEGDAQAQAALQRAPRARSLHLGGLGPDDARALAGPQAGGVDALVALTAGNPLFITELVRHRATTRAAGLPPTLQAVIGARIDRVAAPGRRVLDAAAVTGELATPSLVRRLGGDGLDLALASGLLRLEGHELRFSHALVQESLYEALAPGERTRLHLAAADAIEERVAGEPGRWEHAAAFHAWSAGPEGDPARALSQCLRAADLASRRVAHAEAALHLDRALEVSRWPPEGAPAQRVDLLVKAAEAHHWAGARPTAWARLRDARQLAIALGDQALLARAALGMGLVAYVGAIGATNDEELGALYEALQALAPEAVALRAALQARIAMLCHWSGLAEAARSRARAAQAVAAPDPGVAALTAMASYLVAHGPEADASRGDRADQLVAVCRTAGLWDLELAARMWRLTEHLAAGRAAAFQASVQEARILLEQRRHPVVGHVLDTLLLQLGWNGPACDDAIAALRERCALSRNPNALTMTIGHLFVLRRDQGRLDELGALVDEARPQHPNIAFWEAMSAVAALDGGRRAEARERAGACLADPRLIGRTDPLWLGTLLLVAEVIAAVGSRDQMQRAVDLLAPSSGRHGVLGNPVACLGPVDGILGRLALGMGDTGRAIALLDRADRDATALGAVRAAARVRLARLAAEGRPVDDVTASAQAMGFPGLALIG